MAKVVCHRETDTGITVQSRYYISGLEGSAQRLLEVSRAHLSIENSLHWTIDVTFREYWSRVRKDRSPQNLAILRQISHTLLKRETGLNVGILGRRLQADWREDYLLMVLLSQDAIALRAWCFSLVCAPCFVYHCGIFALAG